MRILVLNGGSSTFKCALYEFFVDSAAVIPPVWNEKIEWNRTDLHGTLEPVLRRAGPMDIAGHRIVHGGGEFRNSIRLTPVVHEAIAALGNIAPAHNRYELEAVDSVTRVLGPGLPQVAVFDTAFHSTIEPAAYVYAGPHKWLTQGIRRYGFHGISYQYATRRAAEILGHVPVHLLVCHLGNGASLCAVRNGKSVDTTMGFTPLEGLMMGTRSGSIDPGIVTHLLRTGSYTADQLDHILNDESGLLGVSGISGDLRTILDAIGKGDARARLAFDVYTHRLAREAGSMIAVLGGMDALVFTGGVGENSPLVREALCRQLSFIGVILDVGKNANPQPDEDIAALASRAPILVIHAQEEWEIARECWRLADSL
jgi:acetate kinase